MIKNLEGRRSEPHSLPGLHQSTRRKLRWVPGEDLILLQNLDKSENIKKLTLASEFSKAQA